MKLSTFFTRSIAALGLLLSSVAMAKPVNINTASADEIAESLAGIGPATAQAIVAYRNQNGAFDSLDDLLNIKGIGQSTLNKIGPEILFGNADASNLDNLLNVDNAPASGTININQASAEELSTLSGIGASTAAKIVSYRETYGPFNSVDELANVSGIGAATIDKNRQLMTAGASGSDNGGGLLGDLFGDDTTAANAGGLIDINSADAATLAAGMVGVGDSTAAAIVAYRQANGPFQSIDDLTNVKGIGSATISKNQGLLTTGAVAAAADTNNGGLLDNIFDNDNADSNATPGVVNINTASAEELAAGLDGVGASTAAKIVAYRQANGAFLSVEDLGNVSGIGSATVAANLDRMSVDTPVIAKTTATPAANAPEVVNINTASAEELATGLDGIGAATAKKIVAYRQANGDFKAVEELGNISGIGAATVAANLDKMIVGVPVGKAESVELTAPININTATYEELQALTYIGPVKAQRIIEYRRNNRIDSFEELMSISGIGDKTIEKNRQWIRF